MSLDRDAARDLVVKHEGTRAKVYLDSLGIPTIGVGFNLQRPDARACMKAVGADFDKLLSGTESLGVDQITTLVNDDIADCVADLQVLLPGFDDMPPEAQLVLVDLRFNLGPNRLRQFTTTLQAFRNGDFSKAARHLQASLWARQVGNRAVDDCAMLCRIKQEH